MVKTILLRQHIGAPATPVVKVGDSVKRGTLLAAPEKLGANVHSSVDGVVKEITEEAVIVEASEKQSDDYVKIEGENIPHCSEIKHRLEGRIYSGKCSGV